MAPSVFAAVRRRAIFDCAKWDPQVEDVSTLAPFPIVLREASWREISRLAQQLAFELVAAEWELLAKPRLQRRLGLPRAIRSALASGPPASGPRVMRFDFHYTREGWRISEVNSDVPGGFNEASGFTALVAEHYEDAFPTGDPAGALTDAIAATTPEGGAVALVHATAFSDDRQVMAYLAKRLEACGRTPLLLAPDHVSWRGGRAVVESAWHSGPLDFVFRFFPAEWLPNLPRSSRWSHFVAGATTPLTNPGAALMTQSKRFPLTWPDLETDLSTWRRLLPETCDPRDVDAASPAWVLKTALGRVGDGVGVPGVTGAREWKAIQKDAARHPRDWVAQRRFEAIPLMINNRHYYPCIGVYTVDGHAAGAYGRLAETPLIDHRAQDVSILVEKARAGDVVYHQEVRHGAMGGL